MRNGTASSPTYQSRFGSHAETCRRLGLPPNLPLPVTLGDEIDILNRYAVGHSERNIAISTHRDPSTIRRSLDKYGITLTLRQPERRLAMQTAAVVARRLAGLPDEEAVA